MGVTASQDATVLAAMSARQMSGTGLNQLARSGQHIHIYTPLDQIRAQSKLASHPQFQLASEKLKAHGDSDQLDTALKQATASLHTAAEQALHLGLAQVEAKGIVFSTSSLLAAALDFAPATPIDSISAVLDDKLAKGDLLQVPGKRGDVVSRASFDMEKFIIATIAQGKGTATPTCSRYPTPNWQG